MYRLVGFSRVTKLCDHHYYLTPGYCFCFFVVLGREPRAPSMPLIYTPSLKLQNTSTICQRNPVTLVVTFHFPSPLSLLQPLICFLHMWICLFWTFHITTVIQYVAFCVWLLSLSIMFHLI
jgi:hypothetical protein